MLDVYPRAQACYAPALEGVDPSRQGGGEGTYVGVGNHSQPFDRLLRLVDDAVARGLLPRPVVAQAGVSRYQPSTFDTRAWLDPGDVDAAIAGSRYVVTHGGTGSMSNALRHGRRPLVLPRLRRLGEHVDDHQEQLVSEMARIALVVPLTGPISESHLLAADIPLTSPPRDRNRPNLSEALRSTVALLVGSR
jgi:UDP-N-acetylglucosamine transferase subunit ALG13